MHPVAHRRPGRPGAEESVDEFQVWGTGGSASAAYPALPADQPGTCRTTFFDDFSRRRTRPLQVARRTHRNGDGPGKSCTPAGGGTYDFTPGRIDTRTYADFTYGRVSVRMKLPVGDGFRPAFQETSRNVLESTRGQWVYDHDQSVILNLALGGARPAGQRQAGRDPRS